MHDPLSDGAHRVTVLGCSAIPNNPLGKDQRMHLPAMSIQHLALVACLSLCCLAQTVTAQCDPAPQINGPRTGTDGFVNAMTRWDPDGAGPQPAQLVVAGAFTQVATVRSGGIALFNEFTNSWSNLGDADEEVRCLLAAPNGDLLVGGHFATISGTTASRIARFDGTNWQSIGGGVTVQPFATSQVDAIAALNNGDIIVGGQFTHVGGLPINNLARWNGTTWSAFGQPMLGASNGTIEDMVVMPNGDLIVTGRFSTIGGIVALGLAHWDGAQWLAMGQGPLPLATPVDLDVMANGDLLCAGSFSSIGGIAANHFATWDGSNWSATVSYPTSIGASARTATALPNGFILAAGEFPTGSTILWDNTQWQAIGSESVANIHALTQLSNGDLLAGGAFESIEATNSSRGAGGLARWDSQAWQPEPIGIDGPVTDVMARGDGEYVVVGDFDSFADTSAGISAQGLSFFDGSNWQSYALPPNITRCASVAELANGNLILVAQNQSSYDILRWVGTQGGAYLGGVNGPAKVIVDSNNDVILGGSFSYIWIGGQPVFTSLAKLSTTTGGWSVVDPGFTGTITTMAALPNGDIVVGGTLSSIGGAIGHLAIWDGSAWNNLNGNISAAPTEVAVLRNGDIAVVGPFTQAGAIAANGVATWDGSSWQAAGTGFQVGQPSEQPLSCAAMPDGGLLVGGEFTTAGAVNAQNLAYWRGGSWNAIPTTIDGAVTALDIAANGDIMLGGTFLNVDGQPSAYAAQLEAICPASVVTYGTACSQGGSLLDLRATSAAWLGSSLEAVASNLPSNAIAIAVYGTQTVNQSLSLLGLPAGTCTLQASADLTVTVIPTGSIATTTLAIPVALPLVGQTIHHQVVSFALGSPLSITSVGSTQGISATLGSLW